MRICCPECKLERDVNPDSIPTDVVMATCPHCKTKFRFRERAETPEGMGTAPAFPHPEGTPSVSAPVAQAPLAQAPAEHASAVQTSGASSVQPASPQEKPVAAPRAVPVRLASDSADSDTVRAAKQLTEPTAPQQPPLFPTANEAPRAEADKTAPPLRHGATDEDAAESFDVPWEHPERYGQIGGLYQTIIRALFGAPKFFAALPRYRGSIMRPLLFYVLLGLFQVLIKMLWFKSVDPSMTDPRVQELISSADMTFAMTFIVSPGILALQLFLYSALFFLMLRLVQPESTQFPVVLRVVAYSSATLVMSAVPVIGPLVAMVWFAASCFMGCRFAMNIPWGKVALALIPLYLIGFAITMQFVQHLLAQG